MNRLSLALTLIAAFAANSWAAITVNDASPGSVAGACTLVDAVTAANTNAAVNGCAAGAAGLDTIVFAPGITSITLTQNWLGNSLDFTALRVSDGESLIIDGGAVAGSGTPVVTIARSNNPGTPDFGIITVTSNPGLTCAASATTLTLKGIRITNGTYSGVYGFHVTITDSIIDGNQSPTGAGGITAVCDLTIADSTVSNNTRTGGILTNALTMSNTTVSGNSGDPGGISATTATITNSTISGNTARDPGYAAGIAVTSATLKFVTITANSTLGGNSSAGVGLYTSGTTTLSHTVIAGNTGAPGSSDVEIAAATPDWPVGDHNWVGSFGQNAQANWNNGALISSCPAVNLGALANNGGGKQTHALLAGSCLLDAGATCSATALPYDERGSGYNRCVNAALDIGAFEFAGATASPPTATTNAATAIGQSTATMNGTVSANGASTAVTFGYGLTTGYGATVTATQSPLASSASGASVSAVADVYCGLTYHFHVIANNGTGGDIDGGDQTFTASACAVVTYPITADANPAAGGTAGCTPNPVSSGGSSTCTATANGGYVFTGWSGACSGANCTLNNVTAAASVTANFSVVSSPAPAGVTAVPVLSPRSLAVLSLLTLLATLLATTVSRRQ